MKRVKREFYGIVGRIPPREGGALAQCTFCEWARFFPDRKRKHYDAMTRAASALRGHAHVAHAAKFPQFSDGVF